MTTNATERPLTPGRFWIECEDGPRTFDGYSAGDRWNGWACPFFTREVAQQIAEALATPGHLDLTFYTRLRWEGDTLIAENLDLHAEGAPQWEEDERWEPVARDGLTLWAVGSWCWTWSEDHDAEDAEDTP